jgi:glycosyltransferase involved in cell wall biosynthesis
LRRPVVASIGGGELVYLPEIAYGTQGSRLRRRLIAFALRQASLVTAGSAYMLELAERQYPGRLPLRLAALGVDTARFQPGALVDWQQPLLVQAASLTPVKNQAMLLEVLRLARRERPELRLRLAGDGPLRDALRRQAERLGIAPAVEWIAERRHPEMAAVYRPAHLYVQSSRHESQGMAVLEAMACGLPVVATPVGVARELAARPAAATAEELAEAVVAVLAHRDNYQRLSRQARQIVEECFSLATAAAVFRRFYEQVSAR